jgi:hypothetical protein
MVFPVKLKHSQPEFECGNTASPHSRLDKDLHTTTQSEDEVKRRLLLNVVVGKGSAVFQLLAGEDKTLLVWGNALPENDVSGAQ